MKTITIDLRTSGFFGPACKFVELLSNYQLKGYKINIYRYDNVAVIMIAAISQKWRMNDVSEDIAL